MPTWFLILMNSFFAFVITTGTAITVVITDSAITNLSDIGSATWLVIFVGGLMASAKDAQSRMAKVNSS